MGRTSMLKSSKYCVDSRRKASSARQRKAAPVSWGGYLFGEWVCPRALNGRLCRPSASNAQALNGAPVIPSGNGGTSFAAV